MPRIPAYPLGGIQVKAHGDRSAPTNRQTGKMALGPGQPIDDPCLDRTEFSVASLTDADDAVGYWLTRPVDERLRALELLRGTFYGASRAKEPLQRVFEVVQLERS